MGSQGNVVTDGFFILCALALLCGMAWWVMPESLERDLAAAMQQAALPLAEVPVVEGYHAEAIHGAEAIAVRDCIKGGGMFAIWQKPDGRFLRLCQLPDGQFGTQICADSGDCFHEITAYIKNKFTRLEQLIKYLENMGAFQVWP